MKKTISLKVNSAERSVEVEARTTLLEIVREQFGLTGAKLGAIFKFAVRARCWSMASR